MSNKIADEAYESKQVKTYLERYNDRVRRLVTGILGEVRDYREPVIMQGSFDSVGDRHFEDQQVKISVLGCGEGDIQLELTDARFPTRVASVHLTPLQALELVFHLKNVVKEAIKEAQEDQEQSFQSFNEFLASLTGR